MENKRLLMTDCEIPFYRVEDVRFEFADQEEDQQKEVIDANETWREKQPRMSNLETRDRGARAWGSDSQWGAGEKNREGRIMENASVRKRPQLRKPGWVDDPFRKSLNGAKVQIWQKYHPRASESQQKFQSQKEAMIANETCREKLPNMSNLNGQGDRRARTWSRKEQWGAGEKNSNGRIMEHTSVPPSATHYIPNYRRHLPPPGTPGGVDDPLKRGLSGAGFRWYLRFLDQGMEPEVARAKALERRQQQQGQAFQSQPTFQLQKEDMIANETWVEKLPQMSIREDQGDRGARKWSSDLQLGAGEKKTELRIMEHEFVPSPARLDESCKVKKIGPKKKHSRRYIKLPPLGKPGGLDDPLRKGLSGAGTRWYLRFLEQGMEPEVARAKAQERRQQQQAPQSQLTEKRVSNDITPPVLPDQKTSRVATATSTMTGPRTRYAKTDSSIQVAILPLHPEHILSSSDLMAVEEALVQEMILGAEHKIKFTGINSQTGMLLINCVNENTVAWLKEKTPRLQKWKGVALKACVGDEIPNANVVTVFFPRSSELSIETLLALVDSQNVGLYTHLWEILSNKEDGSGRLLTMKIDAVSLISIKQSGNCLFYRFGKIPVSFLKEERRNINERAPPNPII